MRTVVATLLVSAVLAGASPPEPRMRWEATGGPVAGHTRRVTIQQRRFLLSTYGVRWRSLDGGTSWAKLPDDTPAASVVAANDRDLFAGAGNGVQRTSDMGDSWTPCGDLPVKPAIGHTLIDMGADRARVYVLISKLGLFRSEDRCATWSSVAGPWTFDFPPAIHYVNGPRVIVRALGGVYLSVDAGINWARLDERLSEPLTFVTGCDAAILVATGRGIFRSRDDGRSWALIGLEGRFVPAMAAPRCDQMFAAVQDAGRWTHSVLRSADQGSTWTASNDGLTGHPIRDLLVDDEGTLYAAGVAGTFRWSSEGRWQQFGPADATVVSLVATPSDDVLAAAGATGLFRARTPAEPWRMVLLGIDAHRSEHAPGADAYAYSATMTREGTMLVSTQAGVLQSRDSGNTWQRAGLTKIVNAFLATPSGTVLAGTDTGIFRSTDDGNRWIERSIGLSAFKIHSLASGGDGAVYAGSWEGDVSRSTDEGDRWRPLPSPLPRRGVVQTLLVLKSGDLLAGIMSGLFRWEAANRSWRSIRLPSERSTVSIRALVQDARGIVVAASDGDGVFVSFDAGTSWVRANDGLTDSRVFSLAVDATGHFYAGTSSGVFRAGRVH